MTDTAEPFLVEGTGDFEVPQSDVRGMAIAFAAGLAAYCISASPVVFWGDSAEFSLKALEFGSDDLTPIARGYPLHTALMWLMGRTVGDVAFGANLVSALFGAVTIALAYETGRLLGRSSVAGAAAALTLGLAHTFWTYAGVAEVYTLHTSFMLAAILVALRVPLEGRGAARLLGVLLGLSMLHHRLILFTYPCILLWLLLALGPGRRLRTLVQVGLGFAVGLVPFVLLCVFASRAPPPDAGNEFLWWFRDVFMGGDRNAEYMTGAGSKTALQSASYLLRWIAFNLPGPALLLAAWGAWSTKSLLGPRVLAFFASLVAIHLIFPFRYDWTGDQYAFLVPAYPVAALFVAIGVGRIEEDWGEGWGLLAAASCAAAPILLYGSLALTPLGDFARERVGLMAGVERSAARAFFLPVRLGDREPHDWCVRNLERLTTDNVDAVVLHADWGDGMIYRYLQEEASDWQNVEVRVWFRELGRIDPADARPQWLSVMPYRAALPEEVAKLGERVGPSVDGAGPSGLHPIRPGDAE